MGAQAVAIISNIGTYTDVWTPAYQLMRNDNTSVVQSVNSSASQLQESRQSWLYESSGTTIEEGGNSWPVILAGSGLGALLGWMLNDQDYEGFGATLPRYNCTTGQVEVMPGDNDGNSRTISTVVGAGLGALMAYLAQPSVNIKPDPATGRDRYLAEMYYKQQLDQVGVRAVGQIAVQIAIDNYIASKQRDLVRSIANDQAALANRQIIIAEKEYCRYEKIYVDCEDATVQEVCEAPPYEPQYELHMGRARNDVSRAFGKAMTNLPRQFTRFCTGANANLLRELETELARAEVDGVNHAWRFEEQQAWRREDVRFNRRLQVHNLGRGIKADSVHGLAVGISGVGNANDMLLGGASGYYGALQSTFGRFSGYLMQQSQATREQQFGYANALIARGVGGYYGGNSETATDSTLGEAGMEFIPNPTLALRDALGLAERGRGIA